MDKPSVYHATVVIFLEFFAWGLLTSPTMTVSPLFLAFSPKREYGLLLACVRISSLTILITVVV